MNEEIKVYREHKILKMPEFLERSLKDKEIIKRILFTLFIILLTRLFFLMPAPGIDVKAVMVFFDSLRLREGAGSSFLLLNSPSMGKLSLFALGLMPYITSCFLLQIIGALFKPLRKKYFGGEEGRRKVAAYTYILTLCLCLFQSFFISLWLENPANFGGVDVTVVSGWVFRILIMFSLTCGTLFLLWLANLITERGIGNGVPVIIVASILSTIPMYINRIMYLMSKELINWPYLILKSVVFIGMLIYMLFITNSYVKIPITHKKESYLCLRFSMIGKASIGFAAIIILLPATISAYVPGSVILQKISLILSPGRWSYLILYGILIMFFTYVYMVVVFKPKYVIDNLRKHEMSLADVNLEEAGKYLDKAASRTCKITGLSLAAIAILPSVVSNIFPPPSRLYVITSGLTTMVIIGVFYDIIRQLKAKDMMKQYPGAEGQKWRCVYKAFDEIEAVIRKEFLVNNNIPCVVEPLKFTWGLPIRTAVDQYRLCVPADKYEDGLRCLR